MLAPFRHAAPVLTAGLMFTTGAAHANLLTVNPGFEEGDPFFRNSPRNTPVTGPVGWQTVLFGGSAFMGVADDQPTSEGDNFLYIANNAILFTNGSARAEITAGETYTLSFDARNENTSGGFSAGLRFFDDAGNSLGGSDEPFLQGASATTGDPFVSLSTTATAPEGATLAGAQVFIGSNQVGVFDNFDLVLVPEPGSLALLGLGGLALLRRRVRS